MSSVTSEPLDARRRPALRPITLPAWVGHVVDAGLAVAYVAAVWWSRDSDFTWFVTEDGLLEWLQVLALAAVLLGLVRRARLTSGLRALVLLGLAGLAFVAIGEELAWGSRFFEVSVSAVQDRNVQGDMTLHNMGALRGLEKTFLAIAAVGIGCALWVVRRRPGLALWFAAPAIYALVRVLDNDPITPRFAKLSEVLELLLYAGLARVALSVSDQNPTERAEPSSGSGVPVAFGRDLPI